MSWANINVGQWTSLSQYISISTWGHLQQHHDVRGHQFSQRNYTRLLGIVIHRLSDKKRQYDRKSMSEAQKVNIVCLWIDVGE